MSVVRSHCLTLRSLWTWFMDCTINFFSFYRGGKIIIQNWLGPTFFCSQGQMLHNFASASCKTLLFQSISCCKTYLHLASLLSIIFELTVQNTVKDQQTCNIVSSCVILSPGYPQYCGSFLWKWWKWIKNNPFLDLGHCFVS